MKIPYSDESSTLFIIARDATEKNNALHMQ